MLHETSVLHPLGPGTPWISDAKTCPAEPQDQSFPSSELCANWGTAGTELKTPVLGYWCGILETMRNTSCFVPGRTRKPRQPQAACYVV